MMGREMEASLWPGTSEGKENEGVKSKEHTHQSQSGGDGDSPVLLPEEERVRDGRRQKDRSGSGGLPSPFLKGRQISLKRPPHNALKV